MKKLPVRISYLTAFSITVAGVLKINHFPGAGEALAVTGCILAVYFPIFVIDKMRDTTSGKVMTVHLIGGISAGIITLGVTSRLWHWPGADILLTTGLLLFSIVFVPIRWMKNTKRPGADKALLLSGALGLSAFALGVLCKLMHWPGAAVLLCTSPVLLFFVYFPLCLRRYDTGVREHRAFIRNSFFVIVIGMLVVLYFVKSIEIHDAAPFSQTRKMGVHTIP